MIVPLRIHLWAPGFGGFGGGIAACSRELAWALQNDGHDLRLFGKLDRSHSWGGLPLIGAAGWPTAYFAAAVIGSAARRRPDLVVSTHVNFGPAAAIVKRLFGVPYVLVAHGIDIAPDVRGRRQSSIARANAVWAVSEWTRRRVVEAGAAPEKVAVIGNTIDERRFTPGPVSTSTRSRYGVTSDDKVILTIGRMDPKEAYKGYDVVMRALPAVRSAFPRVRYLIAGIGDDRPRLEALATKFGVSDVVTFCGFVPDDELADLYRLADVYAMPSRGEGFGIVFLEAMACGTPVLGGTDDGTVDALANGELGQLVDPKSDRDVAEGLLRILRREGPRWWYDKEQLRSRMLALHGRDRFRSRVREAMGSPALAP